MRVLASAVTAWRSYRGAGIRTRTFLAARLLVLPLKPLASEFERLHGRVLGVGSGHGIVARFLAELNPDVTVTGLDVDAKRVAVAKATERRSPRVQIRVQDVRGLDEDAAFDAAAAVDLMHHVPTADRPALAEALARAVKPGGTLLIKDIARTPRWKHAVNRLHDRISSGEATTASEPAALAELFEQAGFSIERLDRIAPSSPYPHFILRARRARQNP
jgi:cyclopropane fatty-acyl-phospholipid synthase-like methyltransferase